MATTQFVARNGLISLSDSIISGSLFVSQSVTATSFTGAFSGSLTGTASYASDANLLDGKDSSTFATTGSNTFSGSQIITGSLSITENLTVLGTASFQYVTTIYETASVIYSSGSNIFGDATNDTQTLIGTVIVSGSQQITGSTTQIGNITLTGSLFVTQSHISTVDYIDFVTGSDQTMISGRIGWNDSDGTLNVGLKGGNLNLLLGESEVAYVYNDEATTLNKGEIVYIDGAQGNRISVKRAFATADATSAGTIGFVAETITSGSTGFVVTSGVLNKMNTLGLAEGSLLYLSSSAGQYTTVKPQAPIHEVRLGYVQRSHATVGSIYIKVDNGYEIDELHDVRIISASAGELLVRSGSLWINTKQLSGSYGVTGSLFIIGTNSNIVSDNSYKTNDFFLVRNATTTLKVNTGVEVSSSVDVPFRVSTNTGANLLFVSQSGMVVIATSSVLPDGPVPYGAFLFTSGALYIGID